MGCYVCKKQEIIMNEDIIVDIVQKEKMGLTISTHENLDYREKNFKINEIAKEKFSQKIIEKKKLSNFNKSNNENNKITVKKKRIRNIAKNLKQITFNEIKNIKVFFF